MFVNQPVRRARYEAEWRTLSSMPPAFPMIDRRELLAGALGLTGGMAISARVACLSAVRLAGWSD